MNHDKVFIIAEIGVNHNGSLELAKKLIDVAAQSGVDAVKFQSFITDQIMTVDAPKADYQVRNTDMLDSQYDMVKKLELDKQMHFILHEYALKQHVQFLSTPFDIDSLDFLVEVLDIPIIKIASGEITNAPLLLKAAQYQKKIILSTGMCDLADIESALGVIAFGYKEGMNQNVTPSRHSFKEAYYSEDGQMLLRENVSLLHCCTEYPAPFEEVNLRALNTMRQCFGLRVGYSDHTEGIAVPIAATALGATIIEKHITLDQSLPGPDHAASLEPLELFQMVQGISQISKAMGCPYKRPSRSEQVNQKIVRKGIVASRDIHAGEVFSVENLAVKRPEGGASPLSFWDIVGNVSSKSYLKNEVIL